MRRTRRAKYSLRALARDVELSPGMVSQIMACKRMPSQAAIHRFIRALGIVGRDAQLLKEIRVLREAVRARKGKPRNSDSVLARYLEEDELLSAYQSYRRKDPQQISTLSRWYHFALMELLTCELPDTDLRTLQIRLGIRLTETRDALDLLFAAGLIEKHDGRWIKKDRFLELPEEVTQEATRRYHRVMVSQALAVMTSQTAASEVQRRRIIGSTVAVNPENLEDAVEAINSFLFKLTRKLGKGPCTEVYQIGIQLVPLTSSTKGTKA